jgi:multimeric flavodoxin WrbA
MATKTVLIVNGGLGGRLGNTAELLAIAEDRLSPHANVAHLELCREPSLERILAACQASDGFLFGTGTYWESWGSPLQRFFEMTAHTEGGEVWRGKPAGAVVTAHAAGASSVLSRLLAVLNAYGMLIPPFGGMAYTWAADVARSIASDHLAREIGSPEDVAVVCHNLLSAMAGTQDWACLPTSEGRAGDKWLFAYSGRHEV